MVPSGSQVGNCKFQGLFLAMVTFGSHVGSHQFQPFLSGVYAGVIILTFYREITRLMHYFSIIWFHNNI